MKKRPSGRFFYPGFQPALFFGLPLKGLRGADARPPIPRLAFKWSQGDDDYLVGTDKVHEGEFEFAGEDAASVVVEWRSHLRELRSECLCLLHSVIKASAEVGTDRCEVRYLVKKLLPSLVQVPNGFHR